MLDDSSGYNVYILSCFACLVREHRIVLRGRDYGLGSVEL